MIQLLGDSVLNEEQRGNVAAAKENLDCMSGHIDNLMVCTCFICFQTLIHTTVFTYQMCMCSNVVWDCTYNQDYRELSAQTVRHCDAYGDAIESHKMSVADLLEVRLSSFLQHVLIVSIDYVMMDRLWFAGGACLHLRYHGWFAKSVCERCDHETVRFSMHLARFGLVPVWSVFERWNVSLGCIIRHKCGMYVVYFSYV